MKVVLRLNCFVSFKGETLIGFTNKDGANHNFEKNIQETKDQINKSYPPKFTTIVSLL